ncbi:glycoside hydrolase family 5 protein [Caulobacter segnis]
MRSLLIVCFCVLGLTAASGQARPAKTETPAADQRGFPHPEEQVRNLRATLNLLSYDPYWDGRPQTRFKLEYFRAIRAKGFTAVRINLLAFKHMDADGKLDEAWLRRLDVIIDAALKQGLTVIVDEHDQVDCRKSVSVCGVKLLAFWRQIAPRYQNQPSTVIFEIMNEPGGPVTPKQWDLYWREALAIIRQSNKARNVIIGPPCSNSFRCLDMLRLPETDRNLIATFHYYEPLEFTHQGTTWNSQYKDLRGVAWGTPDDLRQLERAFNTVHKWSLKERRPILLGEFGAYETADMAFRVQYTAAVARAAEAKGFGWAYWQFLMNFALYDLGEKEWVDPLVNALLPTPSSVPSR